MTVRRRKVRAVVVAEDAALEKPAAPLPPAEGRELRLVRDLELLQAMHGAGWASMSPGKTKIVVAAAEQFRASLAPADDMEAMLLTQIAATHRLALRAVAHAEGSLEYPDTFARYVGATSRLQARIATLVETLSAYRGKGPSQQVVRVEHVTVEPGGRAYLGMAVGASQKGEEQVHETTRRELQERDAVRGADAGGLALQASGQSAQEEMPLARRGAGERGASGAAERELSPRPVHPRAPGLPARGGVVTDREPRATRIRR